MAKKRRRYTVIRQEWSESERDWGMRPDGYSLHLTEKDRKQFIKKYWDSMPDATPDTYSFPDDSSSLCEVSESVWKKIKKSKNGLRY